MDPTQQQTIDMVPAKLNNSKQHVRMFIREFIQEGKDCDIALSDTYVMYVDFMRSRFPNEMPINGPSYHRITTDYFYKKSGTKNNKAVSLKQLEKDLKNKQRAIDRDLDTLIKITENRRELLKEEF